MMYWASHFQSSNSISINTKWAVYHRKKETLNSYWEDERWMRDRPRDIEDKICSGEDGMMYWAFNVVVVGELAISLEYTDIDRDGHEISRFRGGLPRVLYFPKGLYFPEVRSTEGNIVPRENITILAPSTRDISSVPVDICYIRWSKWMISSKFYVLYDYHEVW